MTCEEKMRLELDVDQTTNSSRNKYERPIAQGHSHPTLDVFENVSLYAMLTSKELLSPPW